MTVIFKGNPLCVGCKFLHQMSSVGIFMPCTTCQAREGKVARVFVGDADGKLRVMPEKDVPR